MSAILESPVEVKTLLLKPLIPDSSDAKLQLAGGLLVRTGSLSCHHPSSSHARRCLILLSCDISRASYTVPLALKITKKP
ncbi:hypothetical protein J6590_093648 [Homalodisca vitripennis]|nr:hypothetical protein J6590_093648 [Homalodisca vitripennis]